MEVQERSGGLDSRLVGQRGISRRAPRQPRCAVSGKRAEGKSRSTPSTGKGSSDGCGSKRPLKVGACIPVVEGEMDGGSARGADVLSQWPNGELSDSTRSGFPIICLSTTKGRDRKALGNVSRSWRAGGCYLPR
jgi:hypothetical protein